MSPEQAVTLLILGVAAGVLSGMFGIGGGVIIVPALILLFGFDQLQANGTSLAALLMPVSIFAVWQYYRAGKLQIPVAAWIALGLIFGGFVGAELAISLPSATLKQLYGFFLLYAAWRFIEPRKLWARYNSTAPAPKPPQEEEAPLTLAWYYLLLVGLIAGVASGLFGIGGGLVIVPALVTLLRFDQHRAVGTSLAALLLPVALPAVLSYYNAGKLDLSVAVFVALGLLVGAFAGAKIALGLTPATVKRLYGIFLLIMGLRFIFGA
jgi:uncharacterized protein